MTSLLLLLQASSLLLDTVRLHPDIDTRLQHQIVATVGNAMTLSVQSLLSQPGATSFVRKNAYPTIEDVRNFSFVDNRGIRRFSFDGMNILEQYTSFGDMNGDNFEDVLAVVQYEPGGSYYLVPLLNRVGFLVQTNIVSLGNPVSISQHHIDNGVIDLTVVYPNGSRAFRYRMIDSVFTTVPL
jgi:hypothetical protein